MIERVPPLYTQWHFYQIKCLSAATIMHLILQVALIVFFIAYSAYMMRNYWQYAIFCGMVTPLAVWEMSYHALYLLSYPNTETLRHRKCSIIGWFIFGMLILISALVPSAIGIKGSGLYWTCMTILTACLSVNVIYTLTLGIALFVLMRGIRNEKLGIEYTENLVV